MNTVAAKWRVAAAGSIESWPPIISGFRLYWLRMKRSRIPVIAVCVICALGLEPPVRAASPLARQGPQQPGTQLLLSGLVLREDFKTRVPDQRLRLRNVDTGAIVGDAVSGKDGAFSFPVGKPGTYVIEALARDGGVIAVSNPISSAVSPFTRDVILRTPKATPFFFTGKGAAVIAAAAGAGIAVYFIARDGEDDSGASGTPAVPIPPVSAER
jgi:hypothetical protein